MNKESLCKFAYFLLRVVVGMLFVQHGGKKWFGRFGGGDASGGEWSLDALMRRKREGTASGG